MRVGDHGKPQVEGFGDQLIHQGSRSRNSSPWPALTTPSSSSHQPMRGPGLARRTFQMVDITEILTHWHAGRSISQVAHSLGVDRNTVRKYVAPAVAAGIVPGGEPISALRWAELVHQWFPELHTTELRHPKFAEIAPFHELIEQMLTTNTVTTVHQRLRDERGLHVSIASFRRYVLATMPDRDSPQVGDRQPQGQRYRPGPVRPQDQPYLRRVGQPLRHADRPGPRPKAKGQAAGGAADPLCA